MSVTPWHNWIPGFALIVGECGVWIGFATARWAGVLGPPDMVESWVSVAMGERAWVHSRKWRATAGPIVRYESKRDG